MYIEELRLILDLVVIALPIVTSQFFISKKSQKDIERKILRIELFQAIDNDYGVTTATEIFFEYEHSGGNGIAKKKYLKYVQDKELEEANALNTTDH